MEIFNNRQLETSNYRKLEKVMNQISFIHIESRKKQTFEKKLEHYTQCTILINEALKLIDEMKNQITNIDSLGTKADNLQIESMHKWIDLLNNDAQLNFDEIIHIVEQLNCIATGIPTTTQLNDNIDQEVIYEEQEVFQ